jgi:hypothetical protein
MSQGEIVGPAASGKLIPSIQPHNRPGTTLNSFGRCLKIIDTFCTRAASASSACTSSSKPEFVNWGALFRSNPLD